MFGVLRTLLAIYVVLLHIFGFPTLGNYAVSFFFILSGFLMTHVMQKSYSYDFSGIRLFWANRFLRLYPTYWLVLLLSLLAIVLLQGQGLNPAMFFPSSVKGWFSNISMLYFDIVPHRVKPRVVPTSWALTNELVFYLLISLGISKNRTRTFIWLFFSVLYYVGTYFLYDLPTFRYSAIPASSLPFAIGAALFWINERQTWIKGNISLIILLMVLFNLNAIYLANTGETWYTELSIYINYILSACIVLLLFHIKANAKTKRLDTLIGYFSYPVYLSHYLICAVYIYFFEHYHNGEYKLKTDALAGYFLALFAFCALIVYFVDIKIDKYKRKLHAARNSKANN
ncbi:acyltransferase family protein [Flavobacterium humi]|uniref:Acyltransferase n=1 Tax=Flavobacterium humi TaxID=2562683 RepID=A0A4Z0L858_9FLAO|nr:acyltransferase [Flavobacterium humi]TGD57154.1 acyltransferase [Flavobacterium humi]